MAVTLEAHSDTQRHTSHTLCYSTPSNNCKCILLFVKVYEISVCDIGYYVDVMRDVRLKSAPGSRWIHITYVLWRTTSTIGRVSQHASTNYTPWKNTSTQRHTSWALYWHTNKHKDINYETKANDIHSLNTDFIATNNSSWFVSQHSPYPGHAAKSFQHHTWTHITHTTQYKFNT
jgi:hypothetical protein